MDIKRIIEDEDILDLITGMGYEIIYLKFPSDLLDGFTELFSYSLIKNEWSSEIIKHEDGFNCYFYYKDGEHLTKFCKSYEEIKNFLCLGERFANICLKDGCEGIINHMKGLSSGTVIDGIKEWYKASDCNTKYFDKEIGDLIK